MKANDIDGDNNEVRNIQIEVELDECLMCVTMIEWLRQAWPEENVEELPTFLPRRREPMVKVHNAQADAMPFCKECGHTFMAMLAQFHRERQAREGQEEAPLRARVEQKLVAPRKQIVLPGQPGFKAP